LASSPSTALQASAQKSAHIRSLLPYSRSLLTLLVYAGGIAPHRVLPVVVDVGTNNEKLLKDPDYLGTRETRLTGDEYFHFMDEFIQACFHKSETRLN